MLCFNEIKTDELVIRLQNKSEEAFSVLYDQYSAALWGVALKMTKNEASAEEILQDVFVKIWRNIDRYDAAKGTLFTWMLNITRNTCKDYFRSKYHQNSLLKESLTDVHHQLATDAPERQEQSAELLILTQKLETKHKEMIELVYIYGYTQEEVAGRLQIPLGTVKTRCREAVRQLRRIYLT